MTSSPSNSIGYGRHRDPQVLRRDRDGEGRVAALVRVDEAREQGAFRRRSVRPPTSPSVAPGGAPASSPAPAGGRCSRPATLVSSAVAVSLAGQPSTSRAMSAARCRGGRTWSAARNASSIVSRSTTTASGSSSVGAISSSSRSGYGVSHGTSANDPHRGQPARAAPQAVEADVRRDPVEPGPNERAAVERLARPPRPQERLLDGVLGLVERGEHPVAVDVELAPVSLGEGRECGLPTGETASRRLPDRSRGDLVDA